MPAEHASGKKEECDRKKNALGTTSPRYAGFRAASGGAGGAPQRARTDAQSRSAGRAATGLGTTPFQKIGPFHKIGPFLQARAFSQDRSTALQCGRQLSTGVRTGRGCTFLRRVDRLGAAANRRGVHCVIKLRRQRRQTGRGRARLDGRIPRQVCAPGQRGEVRAAPRGEVPLFDRFAQSPCVQADGDGRQKSKPIPHSDPSVSR